MGRREDFVYVRAADKSMNASQIASGDRGQALNGVIRRCSARVCRVRYHETTASQRIEAVHKFLLDELLKQRLRLYFK